MRSGLNIIIFRVLPVLGILLLGFVWLAPAFLLALFEQYAAVARAGSGARQAPWFVPLTVQFAAQATRDPLLRRRLAIVLSEAPDGATAEGQLLKALARIWPA